SGWRDARGSSSARSRWTSTVNGSDARSRRSRDSVTIAVVSPMKHRGPPRRSRALSRGPGGPTLHRSRRRFLLVQSILALTLVALLVPPAGAVSLRRQCRLTCKDAINACVAAGGKRARCRRQTLRRCRREGLVACGGAAT